MNELERRNEEAKGLIRCIPDRSWDAAVWLQSNNYVTGTIDKADRVRIVREVLAAWRSHGVPCADGSFVHDFEGQTSCPKCGWVGIQLPEPADSHPSPSSPCIPNTTGDER